MRNSIQAAAPVVRTLAVFTAEGQAYSVTQLASALGVHKSTAARLATTLVRLGSLKRAAAGKPHSITNGRVLLAFACKRLPPRPLEAYTPYTITDRRALRQELDPVRARGCASNVGELEEGLHAVAVPVFDALSACRAVLSISPVSSNASRESAAARRTLQRGRAVDSFRLGGGRL